MKIIEDIRLYKSCIKNDHGHYLLDSFGGKKLNIIMSRIVMKLRESGFSLGEFDHLYIVFTVCELDKTYVLSDEVDKYHPWHRNCYVKINDEMYVDLSDEGRYDYIITVVRDILVTFFTTCDFSEEMIHDCIVEAVKQGDMMLVKFSEKITSKRRAYIYLRLTDEGMYYPLLMIYDSECNLLFRRNMPESLTLDRFGVIQLGLKKITINPRNNAFAKDMKAIVYDYL